MRIFVLLSILLISALAFAEEPQTQTSSQKEETQKKLQDTKHPVLVYPKELLQPLPDMPLPENSKEEFVEVESKANPRIEIELPTVEELLYADRGVLRQAEPFRGADFYSRGGSILTMYGVREPSGQLFNTGIPVVLGDKEDEEE
jgi:hypothetical protein